ncbi:MAG: DegT/DnrJ/EryC1/StrS family aminotransferase [Bdellovibrionales bacterium]|nr:DegT/DnrJ/EryC1/StrS family aminotransferase [Bdellovibrionales bacterium]
MHNKKEVAIGAPATGQDEWNALRESLESGWLTQGPKIGAFEHAFAEKFGFKHACAVSSGTAALHVMLLSLGIGKGDEVVLPALSWISSANVILHCGAKPVFVDIDLKTFNMDLSQISKKITPNTKAIMPVHLFGLCVEMDKLQELAGDIPIVEDAACAIGSQFNKQSAGSFGKIAAFSFHARKVLTTGEGGMIVTSDSTIASSIQSYRNHGAIPSKKALPEFTHLGFNYRMTDLQAAVGLVQLNKLDSFIKERKYFAKLYDQKLKAISWLSIPGVANNFDHSWQAYVCMVNEKTAGKTRDEIITKLASMGVSTRPGTHAIHKQEYYKQQFGFKAEDFPMADLADRTSLALPMHNRLCDDDIAYVVDCLARITS